MVAIRIPVTSSNFCVVIPVLKRLFNFSLTGKEKRTDNWQTYNVPKWTWRRYPTELTTSTAYFIRSSGKSLKKIALTHSSIVTEKSIFFNQRKKTNESSESPTRLWWCRIIEIQHNFSLNVVPINLFSPQVERGHFLVLLNCLCLSSEENREAVHVQKYETLMNWLAFLSYSDGVFFRRFYY